MPARPNEVDFARNAQGRKGVRAVAPRPHRGRRRLIAMLGALATVLMSTIGLVVASPAVAAGDGVVSLELSPIDVADNSVITNIQDGTHDGRITYLVQYSCTTADCDDVQLQFSPSAPDPNGLLPAGRTLLAWESWVGPAGATISGTDATGRLVALGDLEAGDSGSFTMTYTVTPDRHRDVPWGAFYPDGFQIEMAATATSETIVAPITGTSAPVTWNIGTPVAPQVGISAPTSASTDAPTDFNLTMNAGNLFYGPGANVTGDAALAAAGSYTVVYQAPPEANILAAEYGGVIDNAAKTVTWTVGSPDDPQYAARGGWGLNLVSGFNGGGPALQNPPGSAMGDENYALWRFRGVTLEFPGENFPAADESGCNFSTTVSSSISVSVTYLDPDSTTRTATANRNTQVACWDPFGGINVEKLVYGGAGNQFGQGDGNLGSGVWAANIPNPDAADRTALYWSVRVSNRGNIPGVAVIDEPNLSLPDAPVYQIFPANTSATVEWVRSDGATGTTTLAANQNLTAPGATYFTSARITTGEIAPARVQPTDTAESWVNIGYRMRISSTAPLGEQRTNTANITMTYPGYDDITVIPLPLEQSPSRTIRFTRPSPQIVAEWVGAPVVQGGGPLIPGTQVTYSMRGATNTIWPGTTITPELVFIAPVGWTIVANSASLTGGPDGVIYSYVTRTIGGVPREVVVATWPASITPSSTASEAWPTLTVQATPSATAPTGTGAAVALVWAGDASGNLSDAITTAFATAENQFRASATAVTDVADVDNDGNTTEEYAQGPGSAALTVAAPSAMQVVKELCIPDDTMIGGCLWVTDPSATHYVPVNSDNITYRLRVTNGSASALTGVVLYDVLPHVGDTSLLAGATPRGSEFDLAISSIGTVSSGVTLAYSASTNPTRPEVNPGAGTVDDWNSDPTGKTAIRMTVGTLGAGLTASVVFSAAVDGDASADQRACNTVAADSTQTLPSEPLPVCVTLAEADLAVSVTAFDNLQAGRPSTLAYQVVNLGGSAAVPASVDIEVPEGITVTDLANDRWSCTVVGGAVAPVSGPATLRCLPIDEDAQPRLLVADEVETLAFPIVVDVEEGELCTSAEISGTLYDPQLMNNTSGRCDEVAPPPAGLVIVKDDEQDFTRIGAEYTYTITVTNTLLAEAVNDAVVTDVLPDSLEFVSATAGGTEVGQTVTWELAGLAPLDEVELRVTVRVAADAASPVVNEASVSAPDPGFDGEVLTDSAEDSTDVLFLTVTKASDARASGVRVDDVVTYTVTVTGDDAGDYTDAVITDDLSGVLDEAAFVGDSATVSVDGAEPAALADPVDGLLSWTGTIPAGALVVITYQVTVGDPVDGQLVNAVSTGPELDECDTETGLDAAGHACAVLSTPFAPTITKAVTSLAQDDDGSWTIVYEIDVDNPSLTDTTYDLADSLAFGPGITVDSATVVAPDDVTAETWSGTGAVAIDAALAGGDTHTYQVIVVADAGTVAGTAAAVCTPGEALGFANTALLTLSDDTALDAEACAEPVEPTVAKSMDGEPVKGDDGRWSVRYLITVTNGAEEPTGGLAYRLEDSLDFPAGLVVEDVQVTTPAGVEVNESFTGGLTEIGGVAVTADLDLVDGAARIPAATDGTDTVQEYLVELSVTAAAGSVDPELLACGAEGAGYGNWVSLLAGTTELGSSTACAAIRLPELEFTKVAAADAGTRPGDTVTYTIIATNIGDADYTAGDPAELVDDMTDVLDDATYAADAAAGAGTVIEALPELIWTGPVPAGETVEITYSVVLGPIGSGDGAIVNELRLAGSDVETVEACAETPEGNEGALACSVTLQLDTRALAMTGLMVPVLASLAAALAALAIGIGIVLRRRLTAG